MGVENRGVYNKVSLRDCLKGLTIDPNELLYIKTQIKPQIPKRLSSFEIKSSFPADKVKRILDCQHHLGGISLQYLSLHAPSKSGDKPSIPKNETLSLKAPQIFFFNNLNISLSVYKTGHTANL